MTANNDKRSDWLVLLGLGLLAWGVWLLLERTLGWIAFPLSQVLNFVGSIGWPLVLVGLGALLIMRARTEGWNMSGKKLYRSRTDRKIAGVLGGAAVYLNIDANLLRLIYVVLTLFTALWAGFLLYIIAMIIVPEEEFVLGAQAPTPPSPAPAPPVPQTPVVEQPVTAPAPEPAPAAAPAPAVPEPAVPEPAAGFAAPEAADVPEAPSAPETPTTPAS